MADYVVSAWDEFLQYNDSANTVKFANPHEVNGEIVLSGTGTQADPYIVSTYEEMLFATGATYIWEVKLINREQKIYRYEDIYCRYDDSLSTVNFNLIQPEGFDSPLVINCQNDFNGWTLKNLYFSSGNNYGVISQGNADASINNVIIDGLRAQHQYLFGAIFNNCIIQGQQDSNEDYVYLFANSVYVSDARQFNSCSINLKVVTNSGRTNWRFYYGTITNSIVYLEINSKYCGNQTSDYGVELINSVLLGKFKVASSFSTYLIKKGLNSILDYEIIGADNCPVPSTLGGNNLYNNEKMAFVKSGWTGVSTSDLQNANILQSLGFPIGVDADE